MIFARFVVYLNHLKIKKEPPRVHFIIYGECRALQFERRGVTLERLYLVVDWIIANPKYDPELMVLPKDKYPVIHE